MVNTAQTLLNVFAGFASIVGLVFSYLAWRKAAGAEQAAREARSAVRQSNAGEELAMLGEIAKELLACAQNDQIEVALVRSRDLLSGITRARHRWEAFLLEDSSVQIDRAAKSVGRISRALSVGRDSISPTIKQKLVKSCHEVAELLAEEVGKTLRRAEGTPHD